MDGRPAAAQTSNGPVRDPERFRQVLGRFATGVGVMTTTVDGLVHGMTVNAFSSVSLSPPLVLVCVERDTAMAEQVVAADAFAVSFLAEGQEALSARFADPARARGRGTFEGVATRPATTGSPVLLGSHGWLDCRVWASYDGGDHLIVVGEVVELEVGEADAPLVYHGSSYRRLATTDGAGQPGR